MYKYILLSFQADEHCVIFFTPYIHKPPFTESTCPVMELDSSERSISTILIIPSVSLSFAIGVLAMICSRIAAGISRIMPSSMYPGAMQFTVMLLAANSEAMVRVNPNKALFDAEYAAVPGIPVCATIEEKKTILPHPLLRIEGMSC